MMVSGRIVLLAAVLCPPAGLVLLWLRSGTRLVRRLLGSVAITGWSVACLFLFFGLRMQVDGSGTRPLFYFGKQEAHYEKLEASRAEPRTPVAAVIEPAPVEPKPAAAAPMPIPYWTGFRGPRRDGVYDEMSIRTEWPQEGLPLVWRQPVGGGFASFSVAHTRAFTIEQRRHQEVVAAYNLRTGREVWTHGWDAEFEEPMAGVGPRATPTWHDGRLYALGATGEFRCLDAATGKLIWRRNILEDNQAANLQWGMAAAPLMVDEKVIVLPGGPGGKSVAAYHRLTGEPVWKSLDDKQAYTAPMLATLGGRCQIVVVSATRAVGITVEDGALLWEFPWKNQPEVNVAQPLVVGENRLFLSAGYGSGAVVLEITGQGARPVWRNTRMKNKFSSSVLYEGHIYGLDEAILACLNAETGELKWKGGRYGYGQLLLASGRLIVTAESGEVVMVKATPEGHQELARFPALSGKATWNVPAIAGGLLLVRNPTEMACFRIGVR
ncbi:MAG: PQQ-like beta-propeller repeat protein [Acidobacteria bacterium]|nr:PQQ-like beta-propeller repeat protein [Acidobacteriota bacterium]